VETLVSTQLDPGADPVKEANRRGSILCVIRMGSVDLEPAHSPPLLPTGPAAMGMALPAAPMMPLGMPAAAKPAALMPAAARAPVAR
jgi:hypothetical protein